MATDLFGLLRREGAALPSLADSLSQGRQARLRRDAMDLRREQFKEQKQARQDQREQAADSIAKNETQRGQLQQANRQRFFAQQLQQNPQNAERILIAARSSGVDIPNIPGQDLTPGEPGGLFSPGTEGLRADISSRPNQPVELQLPPEEVAQQLQARATGVLGQPEAVQRESDLAERKFALQERKFTAAQAQAQSDAVLRSAKEAAATAKGTLDGTGKLFQLFTGQPLFKTAVAARASAGIVNNAPPTRPGDLSMILAWMKVHDPGSVVSGPEGDTVKSTKNWSEEAKSAWARITGGAEMGPAQRAELRAAANSALGAMVAPARKSARSFRKTAIEFGLDPDFIDQQGFGVDRPRKRKGRRSQDAAAQQGNVTVRSTDGQEHRVTPEQAREIAKREGWNIVR